MSARAEAAHLAHMVQFTEETEALAKAMTDADPDWCSRTANGASA